MKSNTRTLMVLLTGLILGLTLAIGQGVIAEKGSSKTGALPLDELRSFTDVFARIKKDYVEEISDKTLLENAIRGMLSGLDPHIFVYCLDKMFDHHFRLPGVPGLLGIRFAPWNQKRKQCHTRRGGL